MNPFALSLVEDQDMSWEIIDEKIKRKVMTYNQALMLVKVAFLKGGIGTMHKHPHLQISYIASGVFETTIGEDTKILKEGDVYFVPSDVMHGVVCLEDGILVDVFNPMREDFVA